MRVRRRSFLVYLPLLCLLPYAVRLQYSLLEKSKTAYVSTSKKRNRRVSIEQEYGSIIATTNNSKRSGSLLIAQYAGGNGYSALLNATQPINQAYAQLWDYSYLFVSGTLIQTEQNDTALSIPESRATYNKVMLLERVLTDRTFQHYDKLLILDADALMYDFSRDIARLLPTDRLLAAHKVNTLDTNSTTNVNIGVTIWNLRHSAALPLVLSWKEECLHRIRTQPGLRDSDQNPLQRVLRKIPPTQRERIILALAGELGYGSGRFVRHYIRPDADNWTDSGIETRLARIRQAVHEVCGSTFTATSHPAACIDFFHSINKAAQP